MKHPHTLVLTRADVERVATMSLAVEAVEAAFASHGRGEARMPPKVYLDLPDHDGDFRAMPAALADVVGVKWVNSHPQNPARHGLPSVMGIYVLSDPATALPLAVMDATWLTALRTGAAAGVASKHCAVRAPRTIGFVGSGVQARTMLAAHRVVFGDELAAMFSDRSPEVALALARELGGSAVSIEEASGADIVCTSTPSRTPVVERAWLSPHAHVNAMGADGPGKQELDPSILRYAQVVIDEPHQAEHSGEINVPITKGLYGIGRVAGTLGQVVIGEVAIDRGRLSIFDSTGLAIQDAALARRILDEARAQGVGIETNLVGV